MMCRVCFLKIPPKVKVTHKGYSSWSNISRACFVSLKLCKVSSWKFVKIYIKKRHRRCAWKKNQYPKSGFDRIVPVRILVIIVQSLTVKLFKFCRAFYFWTVFKNKAVSDDVQKDESVLTDIVVISICLLTDLILFLYTQYTRAGEYWLFSGNYVNFASLLNFWVRTYFTLLQIFRTNPPKLSSKNWQITRKYIL